MTINEIHQFNCQLEGNKTFLCSSFFMAEVGCNLTLEEKVEIVWLYSINRNNAMQKGVKEKELE